MPDRWTWRVAELPYQYAVEIRGDRLVWIWDSGPGIPPTEEAQPLQALLQQGRAAVPSAWQQIPPPILDQVRARAGQLSGAPAAGADATGPTQFAPAITAQVASQPTGAQPNPQGTAAAPPAGWGPPAAGAPSPPAGWGPPAGAPAPSGNQAAPGPQAGFGPPQGPPPAVPGAPISGSPSSAVPTTPGGSAPVGLPTSASLPTAAPVGAAPPSGDPKAQVVALLRAGEKARAVDLYRQHFKVSAMLAKEEVEYLAQNLKDE
ncbi:MAG: hypothetical protein H6718_01690 [Polyangiaceae bacterium]|nr:hypothetical protein [Myxococcales bacterium]MCB9584076.1 hypothetical protein [Polyangiaceae bacterium]